MITREQLFNKTTKEPKQTILTIYASEKNLETTIENHLISESAKGLRSTEIILKQASFKDYQKIMKLFYDADYSWISFWYRQTKEKISDYRLTPFWPKRTGVALSLKQMHQIDSSLD